MVVLLLALFIVVDCKVVGCYILYQMMMGLSLLLLWSLVVRVVIEFFIVLFVVIKRDNLLVMGKYNCSGYN